MKRTFGKSGAGSYFNQEFVWPEETSVALATRLRFIAEHLAAIRCRRALDVGCGTGELLTAWLAQLCPSCQFDGVDCDAASINHAQQRFASIPNLTFSPNIPGSRYDAVIASEVLEHVEEPHQFLDQLCSCLGEDGLLIVTVPNGYGCSEWMALAETLLVLGGLWQPLRDFKRRLLGGLPSANLPQRGATDTWAVSPHVNFFSMGRIRSLFRDLNLEVVSYRGRMFLHNFLCTMAIDRSRALARLNARLGSALPAWLVSDWMFALKLRAGKRCLSRYRRNSYEQVKRTLNLRRYGLTG